MGEVKCGWMCVKLGGGVGVLAMVLISPGQRLLHHPTASIFLQTATNFERPCLR